MTALYSGTDPKIEALQIQLLRGMPTWKKPALTNNQRTKAREACAIIGGGGAS